MTTKPIKPTAVPTVPMPVPSRTDRVNFAARGDAMMSWFPDGVGGINDAVDFTNNASDFVEEQTETSLASSNYKGDWSGLAGALARPACVRHLDSFWLLQVDLADVTTSQPSQANTDWALLQFAAQSGRKNFISNGGCRVGQEGNVAAAAGAYTYGGADRICVSVNATGVAGTISQLTTGPAVGVHGFAQAVTNLTTTSAGSVLFQCRMHAKDVRPLNGQKVTISCKAYQDTGATINVGELSVVKPTTTTDTFASQTALHFSPAKVVPSGTITPLTWTLTLGASDAALGLGVTLTLPFAAALTSKNFAVTDWQLELGGVATALELVDIATEELRCKRTLECFPIGAIDFIGNNHQAGQNNSFALPMKVSKHVAPTAVSGSYTLINASGPSLAIGTADNVVLNVPNVTAGQWRLTNSSIVKIRCDL